MGSMVYVLHTEKMRNCYKIFIGKLGGKRSLGRLMHRGVIVLKWILMKECVRR
jgi:hypothetical protein